MRPLQSQHGFEGNGHLERLRTELVSLSPHRRMAVLWDALSLTNASDTAPALTIGAIRTYLFEALFDRLNNGVPDLDHLRAVVQNRETFLRQHLRQLSTWHSDEEARESLNQIRQALLEEPVPPTFRSPKLAGNEDLADRLARIEAKLDSLIEVRTEKEYYTTAEVATRLGRAEFTVREWCRHGRIYAEKRACGRGNSREWMISHEELQRIASEGLLPTE